MFFRQNISQKMRHLNQMEKETNVRVALSGQLACGNLQVNAINKCDIKVFNKKRFTSHLISQTAVF